MTYYKATRIDGTSFHDGTTTWTVGKITRLPKSEQRTTLCEAGVLHASTEPGESLVGGSWPCRLFEVEPVGELITEAEHPYKVGAHAWRVVREIEAWRALGPNGEAVAALIERAGHLTLDEAGRLADAAWSAAADAAWGAAWRAAAGAAWGAAAGAAWVAAADAAWVATRDTAWVATRAAAWDAARHAAWVATRHAARDAAAALVVRDLISQKQFQVLYGPWASVMEGEG